MQYKQIGYSKKKLVYFDVHYGDTTLTSVHETGNTLSLYSSVSQNYPNPFNPITRIEYSVKDAGPVKLTLHDIIGRIMVELVNENKLPGEYSTVFNAGDHSI